MHETWNTEVVYQKINEFKLLINDGSFWINPYTGDTLQGQLPHVEMIRQKPEMFGLADQPMPKGDIRSLAVGDQDYEDWLIAHDNPGSKMKLGVFRNGWIRGSFNHGDFFEITGIPMAIQKVYPYLSNIIMEKNPKKIIIEIFDGNNIKKNIFKLPDDLQKFYNFFGDKG